MRKCEDLFPVPVHSALQAFSAQRHGNRFSKLMSYSGNNLEIAVVLHRLALHRGQPLPRPQGKVGKLSREYRKKGFGLQGVCGPGPPSFCKSKQHTGCFNKTPNVCGQLRHSSVASVLNAYIQLPHHGPTLHSHRMAFEPQVASVWCGRTAVLSVWDLGTGEMGEELPASTALTDGLCLVSRT